MYPNHLKIDTKVGYNAGPSSVKGPVHRGRSPLPIPKVGTLAVNQRARSVSKNSARSAAAPSPITPLSNASSTSLHIPDVTSNNNHARDTSLSPSPTSPVFDETVRLGPDYVLAMHDFSPQHQNATCLSFRAGQVIHVFNRDSSGWWDGELEGRRGWFPSNYVTADVGSLTEEELPESQRVRPYILVVILNLNSLAETRTPTF
jgi:son of sevenless-like protein